MRILAFLLCVQCIFAGRSNGTSMGPDMDYVGKSVNIRKWVGSSGTTLNFRRLKVNNMGGLGPTRGPPVMHFVNVGRINGKSIDLVVSNPNGGYRRANLRYRWRRRTGVWFARRYNRAYRGVGMMGSLRPGEHTFKFTFYYTGTRKQAAIPYLPLTMYDLDGNKEFAKTCDAIGILVQKPTGVRYRCSGGCCSLSAARREYPFPRNFDRLNRRSRMAAGTFVFRGKSTFTMKYRTSYPHRVFLFKGSKALKPRRPIPRRFTKPSKPSKRTVWGRTRRSGTSCYRMKKTYAGRRIVRRQWVRVALKNCGHGGGNPQKKYTWGRSRRSGRNCYRLRNTLHKRGHRWVVVRRRWVRRTCPRPRKYRRSCKYSVSTDKRLHALHRRRTRRHKWGTGCR